MSASKRFRVTVSTHQRKTLDYTACTWLDDRKAIALVSQTHALRSPDDPIYEIVRVEPLGESQPDADDITDRMEW